ncbi:hypothetical protein [Streptomyces litchfieldiae]|uniref:Lipoprotein n=1 Tax=Streptomyces litchfieldiae TaxID=3075543 RepID=A0ABU2MY65_9ACTN|nr:hypothetical protein [Streptomyces sp. DSM 44938]MDT0346213.1 hypothetical protein [Streptomyces sp. DSM 44938]
MGGNAKWMRTARRARGRAVAVVTAMAVAGLLAGCGSDGSGDSPEAAESPRPEDSSSAPEPEPETEEPEPEPEPETEPSSPCYDGQCEVTVSAGTEIPVDSGAFGVTTLSITSIEEVHAGSFSSPAVLFDGYDGTERVGSFSCGLGSSCTFNESLTVVPTEVDVDAGTALLALTPEPAAD